MMSFFFLRVLSAAEMIALMVFSWTSLRRQNGLKVLVFSILVKFGLMLRASLMMWPSMFSVEFSSLRMRLTILSSRMTPPFSSIIWLAMSLTMLSFVV